MDFAESLRMATRTLSANKLRSGLTMLGIIIGNASVIAMIGIGEGAQKYVNGQLQSLMVSCKVWGRMYCLLCPEIVKPGSWVI